MNEEYRRLREEVNGADKAFIDAIKEAKKKFCESEQDKDDVAIMFLDDETPLASSVFGAVADALAEHGYSISVSIDPDTDTPSLYGWISE